MAIRKTLRDWEIAGFLFVCAAGTLLHALYDWSGGNSFVAAFASVNESTWEHMKLLFVPYFVFTMVEFTVFAEPFRNFFAAKAAAGLLGLALIPVLHYSIAGVFGPPPRAVDIACFFLSVLATYLLSYHLLVTLALRGAIWQMTGFALLWILMFAFILFTYRPPRLPLYLDPTTQTYGVPRANATAMPAHGTFSP